MKTINAANKPNYKSSRDYTRLWELAQTERVICWLDYYEYCTDIASTKCTIYDNGDVTIEISARGTCYILGDTKEDFIRQCKKDNVEFIEPNIQSKNYNDLPICNLRTGGILKFK